MMHTRSQPLPPGGLQSLEPPRRRRTAKTASRPAEEWPSEATERNAATIIAEDHIPTDQAIP
jgi:hypothetical protein